MTRSELAWKCDGAGLWFCPFDGGPFFEAIVDESITFEQLFESEYAQVSETGYRYADCERLGLWHMVENQRAALRVAIRRLELYGERQ